MLAHDGNQTTGMTAQDTNLYPKEGNNSAEHNLGYHVSKTGKYLCGQKVEPVESIRSNGSLNSVDVPANVIDDVQRKHCDLHALCGDFLPSGNKALQQQIKLRFSFRL